MKLDPRTKMVMVLCLSGLALLYNTPGRLLLLLAVTVAMLLLFRFDLGAIGSYLKPFLSLMVFLFVIQCLFAPSGRVLLAVGPVPLATTGGLLTGAGVVLRIVVVTAAAMLLATFNARDFILGLVQWKVPYELAFMVFIALRFLPVFRDELACSDKVQPGNRLKKPWGQNCMYRSCYSTLRGAAKAQRLAVSMEARGFRVYPRRTYLRRLNFRFVDYMVLVIFPLITIVLILLQLS